MKISPRRSLDTTRSLNRLAPKRVSFASKDLFEAPPKRPVSLSGGASGYSFNVPNDGKITLGDGRVVSAATGGAPSRIGQRTDASDGLNCYEWVLEHGTKTDQVVFLDDADGTGHALIQRADGTLIDPADAAYPDGRPTTGSRLDEYLAQHPNYSLPEGRAPIAWADLKGAVEGAGGLDVLAAHGLDDAGAFADGPGPGKPDGGGLLGFLKSLFGDPSEDSHVGCSDVSAEWEYSNPTNPVDNSTSNSECLWALEVPVVGPGGNVTNVAVPGVNLSTGGAGGPTGPTGAGSVSDVQAQRRSLVESVVETSRMLVTVIRNPLTPPAVRSRAQAQIEAMNMALGNYTTQPGPSALENVNLLVNAAKSDLELLAYVGPSLPQRSTSNEAAVGVLTLVSDFSVAGLSTKPFFDAVSAKNGNRPIAIVGVANGGGPGAGALFSDALKNPPPGGLMFGMVDPHPGATQMVPNLPADFDGTIMIVDDVYNDGGTLVSAYNTVRNQYPNATIYTVADGDRGVSGLPQKPFLMQELFFGTAIP